MAAKISDGELIALLRGLRAGVDNRFVHRVDVCSAAPADLVANLEPVPGTDSIWYFYSPKKYKNAQGKTSGHRQRAIGGGDTCWHSEARPKVVDGSEGGTFCNLSYGRKKQGSAGRSFDRLGWCMIEYDDIQDGGGDHVLCKIYRSSKAPSSSSSSKSSSSKRKAAGDHAEARPTKLIYSEQMQQDTIIFSEDCPMACYQGMNPMFADVEYGVQQQYVESGLMMQGSEFIETEYGLMPSAVAQINAEEGISRPEIFEGEECHQHLQQQSGEPEQGGEFVEIPTVEKLRRPQTTSGEGSAIPAAVTPLDDDFFLDVEPAVDKFLQSLQTPCDSGYSLWPNSPSTSSSSAQRRCCQPSAAAMPWQQQGSHWMHPLQLPFLMC